MRSWAVAIVLLAACGRFGFDDHVSPPGVDAPVSGDAARLADAPPPADAAQPIDAAPAIDAPPAVDAAAPFAPPPGAALWLQMETDPTTTIVDSAGTHAIACTAACPAVTAGVHGNAYHFTMQQLQVTYAADLNGAAAYTAAAWIKLDALPSGTDACAFNKPLGAASKDYDTFGLCVHPTGKIYYDSNTATGGGSELAGSSFPVGEWHHLAEVWDGTTKRAYFDGMTDGTSVTALSNDTDIITIGADNLTAKYWLAGSVDDAIFYTRALSTTEITQLATP